MGLISQTFKKQNILGSYDPNKKGFFSKDFDNIMDIAFILVISQYWTYDLVHLFASLNHTPNS